MTGILTYDAARLWCHQAHAEIGQTYEGKSYGEGHLDEVAAIAIAYGFGDDDEILMGCQSHDVPEDTSKTVGDMYLAGFPEEVCEIADCLADPTGLSRDQAKAISLVKIAQKRKAVIVKCCDRFANGKSSRVNQPQKFARYCSEYPTFRRLLRDAADYEMAELWADLDVMFGFNG